MSEPQQRRHVSFFHTAVHLQSNNVIQTGACNHRIKKTTTIKLNYFSTSKAPWKSPLWDLQQCALHVCQAWFHKHKHLHCVLKSLLFVSLSSLTQAQLQRNCLYPLSEACTQTENDLNLESLLNHHNTPTTVLEEVEHSPMLVFWDEGCVYGVL